MDVVPRWRRPRRQGQAAAHQRLHQRQDEQIVQGGDPTAGALHHSLHACLHVRHHALLVVAPAAVDVGDGDAPGVHPLRIQADAVAVAGENLAVADQEPHRRPWIAPQQLRRIEPLDAAPEPVAAQEVDPALAVAVGRAIRWAVAEVQRVGDEAAAGTRKLAGSSGGLIGQGEEAAGGDVIHQPQAESTARLLQSAHLLGMQQQAHALDR